MAIRDDSDSGDSEEFTPPETPSPFNITLNDSESNDSGKSTPPETPSSFDSTLNFRGEVEWLSGDSSVVSNFGEDGTPSNERSVFQASPSANDSGSAVQITDPDIETTRFANDHQSPHVMSDQSSFNIPMGDRVPMPLNRESSPHFVLSPYIID
jgi:hypothetical protein